MCDWSPACPAQNWRFAVVGAGFEEGELLDVVELVDVSGDSRGVYWSCLKARLAFLSKSAVRQHHPAFFRTPCSRWADSNC